VDDTAGPLFAPRQIVFQIVFSLWVSLNEQKWVTFAERRGPGRGVAYRKALITSLTSCGGFQLPTANVEGS
jgi:hypothetical protein